MEAQNTHTRVTAQPDSVVRPIAITAPVEKTDLDGRLCRYRNQAVAGGTLQPDPQNILHKKGVTLCKEHASDAV